MKTKSARAEDIARKWFVVDADDKVLGRTASRIAHVLRGKHKVEYTPHADCGDFVVVINAAKVKVTGKKETDKVYHHHTGWTGGLVSRPLGKVRETRPTEILKEAVWGMLPKGVLGRQMYKKLKVYAGAEHPHGAQQPQPM